MLDDAQAGKGRSGKGKVKPRTASLFKSMDLQTVTLEQALKLLSLPRVVGTDPEGVEITAQNGRYGPYLKKGTDSRSLTSEEQIFTITTDEALAIYAQPKKRGRAAAKAPLRELGEDPNSKLPIVVKDGRFGPYVTDGKTNATLRKEDSVDQITPERAQELLAEKRAKGPSTRRRTTTKRKTSTSTKKTGSSASSKSKASSAQKSAASPAGSTASKKTPATSRTTSAAAPGSSSQ